MSYSARRSVLPFTAIVGQEIMKRALILNAVNPGIGGVLIRGEKGTAKLFWSSGWATAESSRNMPAAGTTRSPISLLASCRRSRRPNGMRRCTLPEWAPTLFAGSTAGISRPGVPPAGRFVRV